MASKERTPEQIRADIAGSRHAMTVGIEGLVSEVHPTAIKSRAIQDVKQTVSDTKQVIYDTVEDGPQLLRRPGRRALGQRRHRGHRGRGCRGAAGGRWRHGGTDPQARPVSDEVVEETPETEDLQQQDAAAPAVPEVVSTTPLPIKMLHDRVLVDPDADAGERRSHGGILIPATVQMGRRLAWAKVVATGSSVRTVRVDDRVLFDPSERSEVELQNKTYVLLRERDLHAIAAERIQDGETGLYL